MAGRGLIAGLIKREPTIFIGPDQVRPDISGRHTYVRGENRLTSHNSWEMFERLACFFGHVGGKVFTCSPSRRGKTVRIFLVVID